MFLPGQRDLPDIEGVATMQKTSSRSLADSAGGSAFPNLGLPGTEQQQVPRVSHLKFGDKTFVLGIGAQKAGTSWLFDYLSNRGDIYMPRKEVHFFDAQFGPLAHRTRRRISRRDDKRQSRNEMRAIKLKGDPELYMKYFESRTPAHLRLFGEMSPTYALIGEDGFSTVRRLFPKVRIIFSMRDPIDRFYSQIRMNVTRGCGKGVGPDRSEAVKDRSKLLARSQYEKTVESLERVFTPYEIIYLFYETLFCRDSIQSLCDFLEVPYTEPDFRKVVNASDSDSRSPEEDVITKLKPTYRFCRERFGAHLPSSWQKFV